MTKINTRYEEMMIEEFSSYENYLRKVFVN